MKNIFYIFIILVSISCKDSTNSVNPRRLVITDTVATRTIRVHKYGIIKKSNPFKINGIECYWEHSDTLVEEGSMDLIKLKDYKTNRILVNHIDCCLKYGFDFYSKDNFLDVNFDGFKDFLIRTYGSMAMFEITNIYLFDSKTKKFTESDLGDNGITTDSVKRKLITSSFDRTYLGSSEKTKTHYFDKYGKLKYTEVLNIEYLDTIPVEYRTYEKIVNGRVVETKKDSVINKENK
jgi:hypothetical protein